MIQKNSLEKREGQGRKDKGNKTRFGSMTSWILAKMICFFVVHRATYNIISLDLFSCIKKMNWSLEWKCLHISQKTMIIFIPKLKGDIDRFFIFAHMLSYLIWCAFLFSTYQAFFIIFLLPQNSTFVFIFWQMPINLFVQLIPIFIRS